MSAHAPAPGQRHKTVLASANLLLVVVFWGSMVPFTAVLLETFDPYLLAALRYAMGLPLLWLLVLLRRERGDWRLVRPGRLAALGAAMAGFSVLYTVGIQFSHPVTASVILTCGLIVASLMARVMYRMPLDRALWLALPVSVGGAVLVALGAPGRSLSHAGFAGGEILLVIAQICWNWYSMKAQQWLSGLGQFRLSGITVAVGSLWLVALYLALWALGIAAPPPSSIGSTAIFMLLWIAITGVAMAILLWNTATSLIGVPLASLYLNLQPFVAAVTAAALGSPPTVLQVLGGIVVLAGILYVQLSRMKLLRHGTGHG